MRHGKTAGAVIVTALACTIAGTAATTASADTWAGTTHGKVLRSTKLVSGGSSWRGNFWFTIDRGGRVHGYAVVAYEPVVDVAGLTNAIGYVRTVGSTALGLLGPFGSAAAGAGLGQIVGAGVSFKEAMAIRRGKLTGRLDTAKGKLTLDWKQPSAIRYDINLVLASGTERIGGGFAQLRSRYHGSGRRIGRGAFVFADEDNSTSDGVKETIGSYWAANRVG
jgi:hypothetical protein